MQVICFVTQETLHSDDCSLSLQELPVDELFLLHWDWSSHWLRELLRVFTVGCRDCESMMNVSWADIKQVFPSSCWCPAGVQTCLQSPRWLSVYPWPTDVDTRWIYRELLQWNRGQSSWKVFFFNPKSTIIMYKAGGNICVFFVLSLTRWPHSARKLLLTYTSLISKTNLFLCLSSCTPPTWFCLTDVILRLTIAQEGACKDGLFSFLDSHFYRMLHAMGAFEPLK